MSHITTQDGTRIHYQDWGAGHPVVFGHGWPLNADSWESQMVFLADCGYRCIAHDRRGKPVQEGVRVRLPKGLTWEGLAAMSPEAIRNRNFWPAGWIVPNPCTVPAARWRRPMGWIDGAQS